MKSRWSIIVVSLGIAIAFEVLCIILFLSTGGISGDSILNRIAVALGGNFFNGGYIQFFTYVAFFWGMSELITTLKLLNYQRTGFSISKNHNLLYEKESDDFTFRPHEVENLKHNVRLLIRKQKSKHTEPLILFDLLKRACQKFRAEQSISEVLTLVNSQCRINLAKEESKHSVIRYLAWAIPSIGFIGTVLGIAQALGIADSGDTKLITSTLGVAFDTTLVALFLSIIMMWFIHGLQEKTEELHSNIEEYVMDNLINKLDT